jgi:hypothetical protein
LPEDGALAMEFVGELAGILALNKEKNPGLVGQGSTINAGCGGPQLP